MIGPCIIDITINILSFSGNDILGIRCQSSGVIELSTFGHILHKRVIYPDAYIGKVWIWRIGPCPIDVCGGISDVVKADNITWWCSIIYRYISSCIICTADIDFKITNIKSSIIIAEVVGAVFKITEIIISRNISGAPISIVFNQNVFKPISIIIKDITTYIILSSHRYTYTANQPNKNKNKKN